MLEGSCSSWARNVGRARASLPPECMREVAIVAPASPDLVHYSARGATNAPEQVSACPCAALPARRLAAGPVQRAQCASTGSPGEGGAAAPAAATDAARWTAGTPKRGSGTRAREEGEAVGTEQMPRRTGSALRLQGLRGTARHVPAGASASSSCQGRGTLCCQSPLQLVAWWCTTVASSLDWMCCAPVC